MRRVVAVLLVVAAGCGGGPDSSGADRIGQIEEAANETSSSVSTPADAGSALAMRVADELRDRADVGALGFTEGCPSRCRLVVTGLQRALDDAHAEDLEGDAFYRCVADVTVSKRAGEETARRGAFSCEATSEA